ncbi:hypothetical protein [Parachitinimonas caeni]|uniref:Uncharacterized protein n=1 Tax=Parachitinimonas caeni TaxID=3031301 RepID=A0ABT7E3A0_9NEIS|nr:hypothetical protein [Parachitinimonas caeni]MDK2126519.1 hypothetical protein [Parachitinimonas caeni]
MKQRLAWILGSLLLLVLTMLATIGYLDPLNTVVLANLWALCR